MRTRLSFRKKTKTFLETTDILLILLKFVKFLDNLFFDKTYRLVLSTRLRGNYIIYRLNAIY